MDLDILKTLFDVLVIYTCRHIYSLYRTYLEILILLQSTFLYYNVIYALETVCC